MRVTRTDFRIDIRGQEFRDILKHVFQAKEVPLRLMGDIGQSREIHRPDFVSVESTVRPGQELKEYDFYFEYVLELSKFLKPLWVE